MAVKIFLCYAREDELLLNKLRTHLRSLQRQGLIDIWYDRDITAGTEWEQAISHQLNTAHMVLLLVSPDFMDSDYCYSKEMKRAMERHERGEARVIPIILRPVHWQEMPFGKLQALPTNGTPVTNWLGQSGCDNAFVDVIRGIQRAIEEIHPNLDLHRGTQQGQVPVPVASAVSKLIHLVGGRHLPTRRNILRSGFTVVVVVLLVGIGNWVLPLLGPQGKTAAPSTINSTPATFTPYTPVLRPLTVSPLVKRWAFQTGDYVDSSPMVVNGVVYVGSADYNLYALDAHTGKRIWVFRTGGRVVSSPAAANGVVYVGADDGGLYAINASTGKRIWVYGMGGPAASSPTVASGVVYVGATSGFYAIDARTGKLNWLFPKASLVYSPPPVVGGIVYVSSYDHNLYALNASSGQPKWVFHTGDHVSSSPTVVNDRVYVGSFDGDLYALNARSGQQIWAFQTGDPVHSSPRVDGSVVYVGSYNHDLYALDASSGKPKWLFPTGGRVVSSPTVASGVVYVGSEDGNLYALDATSEQEWTFHTGGGVVSSPKVAYGLVYVGSKDGNLYAFALPKTSP